MPVQNRVIRTQAERLALAGLDHVTAITADGQACEDFYTHVLGIRAIEPNFDHGDAQSELAFAAPGSPALTFLVLPGARPGRPGTGAAHTALWRIGDSALAKAWERVEAAGAETETVTALSGEPALRFRDPDGLAHELAADPLLDPDAGPLLTGVRAHCSDYVHTADILCGRLDFKVAGPRTLNAGAGERAALYVCDPTPGMPARAGAGSIDHVAWECEAGAQRIWRQRVIGMGVRVDPIREGEHVRSLTFREPGGVTFEIVTRR